MYTILRYIERKADSNFYANLTRIVFPILQSSIIYLTLATTTIQSPLNFNEQLSIRWLQR